MPKADALIQEVRDVVLFNTRRILRSYGARFRYLPDEAVDADDTVDEDETAVAEA